MLSMAMGELLYENVVGERYQSGKIRSVPCRGFVIASVVHT